MRCLSRDVEDLVHSVVWMPTTRLQPVNPEPMSSSVERVSRPTMPSDVRTKLMLYHLKAQNTQRTNGSMCKKFPSSSQSFLGKDIRMPTRRSMANEGVRGVTKIGPVCFWAGLSRARLPKLPLMSQDDIELHTNCQTIANASAVVETCALRDKRRKCASRVACSRKTYS